MTIPFLIFFPSGNLLHDIDQLRTCDRCRRTFPVLSDLFNHICEDEVDARKNRIINSSDKQTSDHSSYHTNNYERDSPLEKSVSSRQEPSSLSFKLNRRSSFNDSLSSSPGSKVHLCSSSSSNHKPIYQTSIHLSPGSLSTERKSSSAKLNIPSYSTCFLRTDSSQSLSPLTRSLFNDVQQEQPSDLGIPRSYVLLRRPSATVNSIS